MIYAHDILIISLLEISSFYEQVFAFLSRPLSSKNKSNGFWGYPIKEEQDDSYSKQLQIKKKVKLIRPDLTTNVFSRILPRKMYKDKERLYSEGLQLKQAFNEVSAENIRLKTQLSMLEK